MRLRSCAFASLLVALALPVAVPAAALAEQPIRAEDADPTLVSMTGVLVSRWKDELVIRDDTGAEQHFRINELTRFVWNESSSPKDLAPGARIRADYEPLKEQRVAVAIWVLGAPGE